MFSAFPQGRATPAPGSRISDDVRRPGARLVPVIGSDRPVLGGNWVSLAGPIPPGVESAGTAIRAQIGCGGSLRLVV